MKYISLLVFCVFAFACDTPKQNVSSSDTISEQAYVSPQVYTEKEPLPPLPADSIPVSYSIKGVAQAPVAFNGMMGEWVATYDEAEAVQFLPGKYVSYYDGQKVVEENMVYYQLCPASCTGGQGPEVPCFVLASAYDQMCFAILNQTEDVLELSLLGSAGGVLTYHRKKAN